jgi:hypothetical protein
MRHHVATTRQPDPGSLYVELLAWVPKARGRWTRTRMATFARRNLSFGTAFSSRFARATRAPPSVLHATRSADGVTIGDVSKR